MHNERDLFICWNGTTYSRVFQPSKSNMNCQLCVYGEITLTAARHTFLAYLNHVVLYI